MAHHSKATLCWADLEPWMDDEYARQVCTLMGWEPDTITVPRSNPDPLSGQQPNNPGYCYLSFPSVQQAAHVLAHIAQGPRGKTNMPNSSKPFVMSWAPSTLPQPTQQQHQQQLNPPTPAQHLHQHHHQQQFPKEYSIFVGDLAPETSNSDLVAVFRNPVLGLRNDREPKFIRPFLSCKSAKIMLDPTTGVSRGYGFVRFTDEADQQRALIEMHGLYCLSRPMRISPATAKFKAPAALAQSPFDLPHLQYTPPSSAIPQSTLANLSDPTQSATANNLPLALPPAAPAAPQTKSVSAPIAASSPSPFPPSSSGPSIGNSQSTNSLASGASSSSTTTNTSITNTLLPSGLAGAAATGPPSTAPVGDENQLSFDDFREMNRLSMRQMLEARAFLTEDAYKHHAQARAILGNLIGPNGEQLTSTDPYNTTVFVGGLSPLISEDTLRTFFAPFGEIHYVKVPVGKHCGFVQFVKKADAEKAIEKMQGFPIGGSRIRLSWGRSQYKAAQAAAQAAQAAALQAHLASAPSHPGAITSEQAMQLLQRFNLHHYLGSGAGAGGQTMSLDDSTAMGHGMPMDVDFNDHLAASRQQQQGQGQQQQGQSQGYFFPPPPGSAVPTTKQQQTPQQASRVPSIFSPFSPDPGHGQALYNSSENNSNNNGGGPLSVSSSNPIPVPGTCSTPINSTFGSSTSPHHAPGVGGSNARDSSPFGAPRMPVDLGTDTSPVRSYSPASAPGGYFAGPFGQQYQTQQQQREGVPLSITPPSASSLTGSTGSRASPGVVGRPSPVHSVGGGGSGSNSLSVSQNGLNGTSASIHAPHNQQQQQQQPPSHPSSSSTQPQSVISVSQPSQRRGMGAVPGVYASTSGTSQVQPSVPTRVGQQQSQHTGSPSPTNSLHPSSIAANKAPASLNASTGIPNPITSFGGPFVPYTPLQQPGLDRFRPSRDRLSEYTNPLHPSSLGVRRGLHQSELNNAFGPGGLDSTKVKYAERERQAQAQAEAQLQQLHQQQQQYSKIPTYGSSSAQAPISRPSSGQQHQQQIKEEDVIQDLNGTLALLDLDERWKSPVKQEHGGKF